jgi:Polysaccharide pyruvyl transferase
MINALENFPDVVNVHRVDPSNIGDMLSSPTGYIPWLNEAKKVDLQLLVSEFRGDTPPKVLNTSQGANIEHSHLIVGGGGLLNQCVEWNRAIEAMLEAVPKTAVVWGAGLHMWKKSTQEKIQLEEPSVSEKITWNSDAPLVIDNLLPMVQRFDLFGLRDSLVDEFYESNKNARWVPCASALHPDIEATRARLTEDLRNGISSPHEVVVFEHYAQTKKWEKKSFASGEELPRMDNNVNDFKKVINFLSSGKVVVTNSFHGAYWATLLGCAVCVYDEIAIKFKTMRHSPGFIKTSSTVEEAKHTAKSYPNAFEECRQANLNFANEVKQLILSKK